MLHDAHSKYWFEAVSQSLDANDIHVDRGTEELVAVDMMHASEMQSQAFGYDAIPSPMVSENQELQKRITRQSTEDAEKFANREEELIDAIRHWKRKYENILTKLGN